MYVLRNITILQPQLMPKKRRFGFELQLALILNNQFK
jgi:hypothetical protein